MTRRSQPARSRARSYRRRDAVAPAPSLPDAPGGAASAAPGGARAASAPVSTKITTTDYGYVVGELRRIALLTILIFAILLVMWLLLR